MSRHTPPARKPHPASVPDARAAFYEAVDARKAARTAAAPILTGLGINPEGYVDGSITTRLLLDGRGTDARIVTRYIQARGTAAAAARRLRAAETAAEPRR